MNSSSSFATLAIAALALAACKGGETAPQASGSASASGSAAATASSDAACAPVKLDVSAAHFAQGSDNFAEGKPGRTRIAENFAKAYAAACAEGMLAKKPLVDPRSAHKDTLFIANAPEANEGYIRFDEAGQPQETLIEGPFVDGEGHVQVPGADAIKEAIYCYAVGATDKEQEESGRCLID